MVRFKAGAAAGAESEAKEGRQPQQTQQPAASDPFDAWDSVLGDSGAEAAIDKARSDYLEKTVAKLDAEIVGGLPQPESLVTVTELPPVAIEPLPAVEGGKCEVVELEAEGGADIAAETTTADNAAASVIASIENEAASILGVDLPVEPPAITAAKLSYLQAALRLSAMEVKIGRLDVEIADLEGQLEEAKEKREALQEATEPQHEAVLSLYNELAKLLPADELAAYEEAIESGEVALPAGTTSENWESGHVGESSSSGPSSSSDFCSSHGPASSGNSAWESSPTSELAFSAVKGCGPKKIEAILDRCPTMGDFEKLRADFYNGGLRQIPGVGEKLAGELENLALEWLTKNRDAVVLRAVATSGEEENHSSGVESSSESDPYCGSSSDDTTSSSSSSSGTDNTRHPPVAQLEISGASGDQATGGDCNADIRQSPAVDKSPEPADGGGGIGDMIALDVVVEEGEEVTEEEAEAEDEPVENPEPDEETPLTSEEEAQLADNKWAYVKLVTIFREKGVKALTPPPQWATYFERGQSDFADGYPGYDCIYTGGDMRTWWMAGHIVAAAEAGVL